jgi:galactose-1-phosphate uridylyltransferase
MEIKNLPKLIKELKKKDKDLFYRFYELNVFESKLKIPKEMESWVKKKFKSKKIVENQKIISIKNKFTKENTIYNELRSKRPKTKIKIDLRELDKKEGCIFCDFERKTPSDVFKRIEGKYCLTVSNLAKYNYFHSIIVFKEHNPLKLKKVWLRDYFEVAEKWFKKVKEIDKEAKYNFLLWNCLWRAGASITHGHMQITSSKVKYGKVEFLEEIAGKYKRRYKSDYFLDLFKVHEKLKIGNRIGKTYLLFYLTPVKEKEIFIFLKEKSFVNLSDIIFKIIKNYFKLNSFSFNFSLFKVNNYWISRIVERGSLETKHSDIGALELYGASAVAFGPFKLAKEFNKF